MRLHIKNYLNIVNPRIDTVRKQINGLVSVLIQRVQKFVLELCQMRNGIDAKEVGKKVKDIIVSTRKKIGRNEPCPCGSGQSKYKKCCL